MRRAAMFVALALLLALPSAAPLVALAQETGAADPASSTEAPADSTEATPVDTPAGDETPTADSTEPATVAPTETEVPTVTETPPPESATEPPAATPATPPPTDASATPTEEVAPPTTAPTPTATPTSTPTATATSTEAAFHAAATRPSQLLIALNCRRNPELTRIDNTGDTPIRIQSLASLSGHSPITIDRPLGAGRTVIFRSGSLATTGTILTTDEFYTNSLWEAEGVVVQTSVGTVTARCPEDPNAPSEQEPPPTTPRLIVVVTCDGTPEQTRVLNNGSTAVTITRVAPMLSGEAPVTLQRKLGPGKTVIFRSGPRAISGTVLTTTELYLDQGNEFEGALVTIAGGQTFSDRCDPPTKPSLSDKSSISDPIRFPSLFPSLIVLSRDPSPNLSVTLNCKSDPETTRIKNTGTGWVMITSIGSLYDSGPNEPFAVVRIIPPGGAVTFQSGAKATSNILTFNYIYTNAAGPRDGVRITTSTGAIITARCA